jgi:hypothetical protein
MMSGTQFPRSPGVLQITVDDVTATLRILERLALVGSHIRLVGGKQCSFGRFFGIGQSGENKAQKSS